MGSQNNLERLAEWAPYPHFTDEEGMLPTCVQVLRSAPPLPPNEHPAPRSGLPGQAPAGPSVSLCTCGSSHLGGLCPSWSCLFIERTAPLSGTWKPASTGKSYCLSPLPQSPQTHASGPWVALSPDPLADSPWPFPCLYPEPGSSQRADFLLPPVPSARAGTLDEPVSSTYKYHRLTQ